MYLTESGIPANGSLLQLHLGRVHSHHRPFSTRSHLSLEVLAARKKKNSLRKDGEFKSSAPVRPPSLYVKQSPVPNRRPLRCVPYTNQVSESESESRQESDISRGDRKKLVSASQGSPVSRQEGTQGKDKSVSKWASLFEGAGNQGGGNKDADAWFDKIFPKTGSQENKEGDVAPKLNAQQARSIQQLQTLVKTLGVANRNPPVSSRRNKPSKMRPLPVQGGVVDPVPFSSILKKLQSVSPSGQEDQRSKLEEAPVRLGKLRQDVEEEDDDEADADTDEEEVDDEEDEVDEEEEMSEEVSEEETESESSSDEEEKKVAVVAAESTVEVKETEVKIKSVNELSKLTVVALKTMAKEKGLSGYSKLKKDELVQLLSNK